MTAIPPKWYFFSTFYSFSAELSRFLAIFSDFHALGRVRTCLEALRTQENTGGMGYGSHLSKIVCYSYFLTILY